MTTTAIDLVSLLEQNTGFRATGSANNRLNGTEYWGMCPFCGTGDDRLHVFPYAPKPHWWCRVCGKTGDHIDILTSFRGMSYLEACTELGVSPGESIQHETSLFYDEDPPPKKWQEMGRALIDRAENYLWTKGHHALSYLLKRGFTEETIKNARLGYIPLMPDGKWFTRSFVDWGLTDEMLSEKQRAKGNVKVPPGILIPWEGDDILWKLAVKRFEAKEGEMRYGQIIGSKESLYNSDSLQHGKPAVLVEGEFDAISIIQTCGDLVAAIGTGSTAKARIPLWIARLASLASFTLLGFDNDENGAGDNAASFWLDTLPDAMRWTPFAHDVNDMLQQNISIREWVEMGINLATMPNTSTVAVKDEIPTSVQQDGLSSLHEGIDGITIEDEQEPLICCVCGLDLNNVEINAYIDPEDINKAYCESDWKLWELSHYQSQEEFALYVATIAADLCDCTVTIPSQNYSHEQRVAQLEQEEKERERAKWAAMRRK